MRYLSEDELTQVMGLGYFGEVRQGPDGQVYQWVEGVDGLGNLIGSWRRLRRVARGVKRFARRRLRPLVRGAMKIAPLVPGVGPAAAAALKTAAPILQRAGVAGHEGIGALYQAADGSLYQVQGMADDGEELQGFGLHGPMPAMGLGSPDEVRQGPDGQLYQWVEGVDGLGNPVGFWKKIRRAARGVKRLARRTLRPLVRKVLPMATRIAPFIPGVGPAAAAALKTATPVLRRAGVAGYDGLGALYQAPDGTLYQVQGMDDDGEELQGFGQEEELMGFAEDEELQGLADEEELMGLAEEEDLQGFGQDEELMGFEEDEELQGLADEEELEGLEQGYIRQDEISGLEAYVPEKPPRTNWFTPAAQPPYKRTLQWEPLW
jgi:hypothetical protein